tara:strand:- start:26781 stop:27494 length:714 start_codon:yes stop_codon:yes gene_type:complete
MKEIIAIHGWCGDSKIWEPWKKYFELNGWSWKNANRGYGAIPPINPNWSKSKSDTSQKRLLICHSLGSHLIDEKTLSNATSIILLSSFSQFIPDSKESRHLKKALEGMKRSLGTFNEKAMLKSFLSKVYLPHTTIPITHAQIVNEITTQGRAKLIDDLELLINTNGLPNSFPIKAEVLSIYGEEDSIVPKSSNNLLIKALKKHLHTQPTFWAISKEGHSLFISSILKQVANWIQVSL